MSVQVERRSFNVAEYYRMSEAGILSDNDRVELVDGEVIKMSPVGSRHAACVKRLNMLLTRHVGQAAIVSVQDPIRLDDYSEPEPDIALLRPRSDFYAQTHPTPADALFIVEVADTSAEYDRGVKVPLYARAEIPEVWLIDLTKDAVEIYAQPVNGTYQEFRQAKRGEFLTSQRISGFALSVDAILG